MVGKATAPRRAARCRAALHVGGPGRVWVPRAGRTGGSARAPGDMDTGMDGWRAGGGGAAREAAKKAATTEGKMEMYDKLLMALEDAKKVIRDEIADKVRANKFIRMYSVNLKVIRDDMADKVRAGRRT